ncbi:MAG: hypothetical protein ACPGO3_05210 [Magnetospiraceae bacterium]
MKKQRIYNAALVLIMVITGAFFFCTPGWAQEDPGGFAQYGPFHITVDIPPYDIWDKNGNLVKASGTYRNDVAVLAVGLKNRSMISRACRLTPTFRDAALSEMNRRLLRVDPQGNFLPGDGGDRLLRVARNVLGEKAVMEMRIFQGAAAQTSDLSARFAHLVRCRMTRGTGQ